MGNELKRDFCPPKYCQQKSVFAETLPTLIALVLVAFFSGSMFEASGVSAVVTIIIEAVFMAVMYGAIFLLFRGMKQRLAETYISVCENGVCGICPVNGYKNREFSISYSAITKVTVKGERLFVEAGKEKVILTLQSAAHTCELIQSRLAEK